MTDTLLPSVVLVHGAFADASSWNAVISELERDHVAVVAVAHPLRGVHHDAAYVASCARQLDGPEVLVGHSTAGWSSAARLMTPPT